jgi:dihydrofolate reductase
MSRLVVRSFGVSVDGFGAGPDQSLQHPLGVGGEALHGWFFVTRTFREILGEAGGETGVDEGFARRGFANIGAWILGRHMFGPANGPWPDDAWKGWWGDTPPYRVPVFVLTRRPRATLEMEGGTTFHFVAEGIEAALAHARAAAGGKDVRLGGGVAVIRQYLQARLIDDMHLAMSPVLLGRGENLFAGLDLPALGYVCTGQVAGERANHLTFTRNG